MSASSPTASSRKSARRPDAPRAPAPPGDAHDARDAVAACLAREALAGTQLVLVAFSGGLDSTVLLHAASLAPRRPALVAVHVHHGLQRAADDWPGHCERVARALGVRFECARVDGSPARGESVEAWAREERYAALARVAATLGAGVVLVAHHADDQVETVLMRLARGTGVDGLAGMSAESRRGGLRVLRPLLETRRAALERHARAFALEWVEDPTNLDTGRLRNAIRHRVLPAIEARDARFRARLLERLPALREHRDRVAERARADLELATAPDGSLRRAALAALDDARQAVALRRWIAATGARAPTRARLAQMLGQLVRARGPHGRVTHDGWVFARHRERVEAIRADRFDAVARAGCAAGVEIHWAGESAIELPGGLGRLVFESAGEAREGEGARAPGGAGEGVAASWLRGRTLVVVTGGADARLRIDPRRPSRTLKNLCQEREIPAWMRPALPRVLAHGRLLFAAGVGQDASPDWPRNGRRVTIGWEAPSPDDPRARFGASHQVQLLVS